MNSNARSNSGLSGKKILKKYLILLLVLSALAGRASAYTFTVNSSGFVPTWASMPIPFWINQSGSPQIANGSEFTAVQAAFQTWQNDSLANISFVYQGTTPVSTVGQDGLNVVTFVDSSVPIGLETAAATFVFSTIDATGSDTIQEADIALSTNAALAKFSTSGGQAYDIQSVVTHEVGHLLGLNHSGLLSSVMTPYMDYGLDGRTLSYDDMAGAAELYPQNADFSSLAAIGGTVTLGGNPVFGAHVVAVDANGTPVVSSISNPDGTFELDFLPPGSYRIYAEPLDSPVQEFNIGGNSSSFYNGIATNFGTTYYGDVSSLSTASAIQAVAGRLTGTRNIHALAAGNLNLTGPGGYALHLAAGQTAALVLGGSNIVPSDTFTASDAGITFGTATVNTTFSSVSSSTFVNIAMTAGSTTVLGPKNISVSASGSTSNLSGGVVIVNPQPSSIAVAPASGTVDGGTGVSITGANFRAGAQVYFGGIAASNVQVASGTTIQAVTPANVAGAANVLVVNSDGTWGVQANGFTYSGLPPQIGSVSPLSGPPGTVVTINGAEFTSRLSDLSVSFNGASGSVVSASRTSVTALVPVGATTGAVTVNVAGQSATGPVFTVTAAATSTNLAVSTNTFIDATAGGTTLTFGNNDDADTFIALPFPFILFNKPYQSGSQIAVSTNGWMSLDGFSQPQYQSGSLPGSTLPPALIAPFFADLFLPGGSSVIARTVGTAPNRQLVVEWLNAGILDSQGNDLGASVTFEAILYEGSNDIQFIYSSVAGAKSDGSSATIGIQDSTRTLAVQTGFNQSVVTAGKVISYHFVNGNYTAPSAGQSSQTFSFGDLGAVSMITDGNGALSRAYARILPNSGQSAPSGVGIFGERLGGVLVSEAGVPASPLIKNGRIYAEVSSGGYTGQGTDVGLAIANPGSQPATINFTLTDSNGTQVNGIASLAAGAQSATYLDQSPWNAPLGFRGTLTLHSSVPISAVALELYNNERVPSDALVTTLPVIDLDTTVAGTAPALIPYYADGAGWSTYILLVNPSSSAMSGSIQFLTAANGSVQTLNANQTTANSFSYSVPAQSSYKLTTSGTSTSGPQPNTGSVIITPSAGNNTPVPLVVFSYASGGITLSQAGVPSNSATAFRMYVEATPGQLTQTMGSYSSGFAIANSGSSVLSVNLQLTSAKDGSVLTTTLSVPASGVIAPFIEQAFPSLPLPYQGVLRIASPSSAISVTGLRIRWNERNNFLLTTTAPTNEASGAASGELDFPQIVNGAGWTTQFNLFSGVTGQSTSGTLQLVKPDGTPFSVTINNLISKP